MAVSYKKLWKLLIDKDMKKKDLCAKAGISPASVTKMGRNGHVTTEILLKICTALDCGGAIKGNIVDLWFPTYADCARWGRRNVTVYILDKKA